ncbi:hypothetical protein BV22DRAFT_1197440 [Leucogyrophana mollusca]|uniref:Uncharacterized protein n=1 Tax=Leucogyrophana mollusca TaxID=85980 RepID=A0ACB8BC48_9AGAM|nr:hypothetical protein BV22DRAFT_1197440 [Leucogyrophana mollusca]
MAHAKDKYYWAQLRAALTAGQWSSSPSKAPNGTLLSWSELLRKFNKHCKGFTEVAEVASQTQALSLLLGANVKDEDQYGNELDDALILTGDCTLPEERIEEARGGYEGLMKLETKNLDSLHLALAYYAYALGQPSDCLSHLEKVPKLLDAQSHIPSSSTTRSDGSALQLPGSTTETSTSWTGSFVTVDSSASIADIKDGRAWAMAESIRSICLQGMCHEKLFPSNPEKALQVYASGIPLLNILEFEIPKTLTPPLSPSSFANYRELWRWAESLMFRAITLVSRTRPLHDDMGLIWTLFTHYHACSAHWPSTFRTAHRSIIAVLHLRALILRFRSEPSTAPSASSPQPEKPPQWLSTARSVINEYRTILDTSTRFPKAGDRNTKVEDFVDLCVAVWESSGAMADRARWVLDILWWATRLTFNSYRIFRHMSRLLYLSGDRELAKRTLRLYVQVVSKAKEAGMDDDVDTDRHWVETLVEGSRMLCRLAITRTTSEGVEEACEAGELLVKAKTRLDPDDKQLVARVALAEGIWNIATAFAEQDPYTRPARLSQALAQFIASVGTYPTPSAHHHLALALALPGPSQNIEDAISSARSAVEGEPNEIRHWHLLGLLLTASGQWAKAKGVLEVGADIGDSVSGGEEASENEKETEKNTPTPTNGVHARDFEAEKVYANGHAGPPAMQNGHGHLPVANGLRGMLLDSHASVVPPAATLLKPLPDHPVSSPQEAFGYALQLRMTQMVLTEHTEGAEGAGAKWVDVFGWIAERKGSVLEQQLRSSMDTSTRSANTQTPSVTQRHSSPEPNGELKTRTVDTTMPHGSLGLTITAPPQEIPEQVPPITVTPATPADPSRQFPLSEKRSSSIDRDSSAGKKVQQMLKNRVHKGQEKISTISKKIGHGVVRNGSLSLRRSTSAPDFHAVLQNHNYQASSIHSRRRLRSLIRHNHNAAPIDSPPAPPPPTLPPVQEATKPKMRATTEDRLLSDLWAMSAATFRRLGKIEQAKGAIQEAEVKDQDNPSVWVQLGLYYNALNHDRQAIEAFQKALFVSPDNVSASVHLCRVYLSQAASCQKSETSTHVDLDKVDLVAGMLSYVTRGVGWDVPEAWYFLAKAHGLQGRKDREREDLTAALALSEQRSVRDIGSALGWCL